MGHDFSLPEVGFAVEGVFNGHPFAVEGVVGVICRKVVEVVPRLFAADDDGHGGQIGGHTDGVLVHDTDAHGVDLLGNFPEARGRHATGGPEGTSRTAHHDDATVFRLVGGEIAHESGVVEFSADARLVVFVALHLVIILRGARLSGHFHDAVLELSLGGAAFSDAFQHGSQHGDGLGWGDLLVEDDRLEFLNHLIATANFGDELGLHHLATVGDGVVNRDEVHGGHVDLITD